MKKFEQGKKYACRSVCDHECVWTFTVGRRTAKTLWLKNEDGGTTSHRIKESYEGHEMVYPLGKYSMAPILTAEKVIN